MLKFLFLFDLIKNTDSHYLVSNSI